MNEDRTRIVDLVVDALAVYRITRLVIEDSIFDEAREWGIARAYRREGLHDVADEQSPTPWTTLADNDPHVPKLATLVRCVFCSSVWAAAGVMVARSLAPRQWAWVARMLALSAAGALIAGLEDD